VRVVFDTNIYVSAFVLPGFSADRAMQRIFDGHDTLGGFNDQVQKAQHDAA